MTAIAPALPVPSPSRRVPPLEHGDHLTREEFERRWALMPHVRKAELIDGRVYLPAAAAAVTVPVPGSARPVPPLENGDHLTRDEFERRWAAMPHVTRAELIEGVVYMPAAAAVSHEFHSSPHFRLSGVLFNYMAATPGITGGDNGSLRLDLRNLPQPDLYLMVLPEHGGQARIGGDGYVEGAPELVAEISASTAAFDLHEKLEVYRRNGVREYVVWRTYDFDIDHFALRDGRYELTPAPADGVYRSGVFPGLWIDGGALLAGDLMAVQRTLAAGLATPDHAAFVARLAAAAAAQS